MTKYGSYINGNWKLEGKTFTDFSPVTQSNFADIIDVNAADATAAVEAAQAAFPKWASLSPEERGDYLLKVADAVESLAADFEDILIDEIGSWIGKAKFELKSCAHFFRTAAQLGEQVKGYEIPSEHGKKSIVVREPLGVVSVITPWNVPLNLSSRTTSGILAVGNTVVLKPSEESPISGGWILAKAFEKAGVPKGVFNVLTCSKANVTEVGNVLVSHPKVKAISFTGSTAVGKSIAAKAGGLLKKASVELGGKDAMIILEDANLQKAVTGATFASFFHSGQICMGLKRIYVHQKVADEFIQRFIKNTQSLGSGNVRAFNAPIGPLINEEQVVKIENQVQDALDKGATLLSGGERNGLFYSPTILTNVTPEMDVFAAESFGPVVCVYPFENIETAIADVNASNFGLSGAVFTEDTARGFAIAQQMESGMCHINDGSLYGEALAPFGGVKNSGMGRYGGLASVESFTSTRWITIDEGQRHYPPPFREI